MLSIKVIILPYFFFSPYSPMKFPIHSLKINMNNFHALFTEYDFVAAMFTHRNIYSVMNIIKNIAMLVQCVGIDFFLAQILCQ